MTETMYPERTFKFDRHAGYPVGRWTDEPDKIQWVDEATGLDCLIVRNRMGALCGYVGVTDGHPFFGVGYDQCMELDAHTDDDQEYGCYSHSPNEAIEVHGGLTFADKCHEGAGDEAICHVPYAGRPDHVWWFGFDTAHLGDLSPRDVELAEQGYPFELALGATYKDVAYVKDEVRLLAAQLAALK